MAGLRGLLEAHQRFGIVNALRVPLFAFNFVGPAVTLLWSNRLDVVIGVLVAGRVVGAWIDLHMRRRLPAEFSRASALVPAALVRPLVQVAAG